MINRDQPTQATANPPPVRFSLKMLLGVVTGLCLIFGGAVRFGALGIALIVLGIVVVVCSVRPDKKRAAITSLAIVGVILLLAALLIPFVNVASQPAYRKGCANNLKQIGLALHNYHVYYGAYPPAYTTDANGEPLHSWRVLILPFMEENALYDEIRLDEEWNSPHNAKLLNSVNLRSSPCLACPKSHMQRRLTTSYLAVVGPGTIWEGTTSTKIDDVTDGISNTLIVVEVANSGIHWAEPRDLHILQMAPTVNRKAGQGISSTHESGANVLFADGHVVYLHNDTSAEDLRALITRDGGETLPPKFDP